MAAYQQIQEWVREQYGWTLKTCWIAHCKELAGLQPRKAPNRSGEERKVPCPDEKQEPIFESFRHFKMIRTAAVCPPHPCTARPATSRAASRRASE